MYNTKRTHITFMMAFIYLILGLIIQASFTYAEVDIEECDVSREILKNKLDIDDEAVRDFHEAKMDWIDMFLMPNNNLFPTSSVSSMAQVTNSNKTAEEQLNDIKEMAQKITLAIQSEMANLLSYAINSRDKDVEENQLRKRRSVETPLDSTQLIMRLLKHIKSNNEYQNIAIEKMMSAQEIAEKFGIEFNPDPEVLSDLAVTANEQTKELSSILEEACTTKNSTQEIIDFVSLEKEKPVENASERNAYFVYSMENAAPQEHVSNVNSEMNHVHYADPYHNHHHNYPYETQMPSPPVHHSNPPMTPRPNFYDSVSFTPAQDYYPPYCSVEPFASTSIVLPFEKPEPEPELMAEEFEETITSKIIVERGDEPGSATVNHITTYTLAEKSHFKTPEIERLPQQMQYSFFLL